jgi:transposase-like protein
LATVLCTFALPVRQHAQTMVSALVHTVLAQPDPHTTRAELARVVESLENCFPKASRLLADAQDDILAYMGRFPHEHRKQVAFTNRPERLNRSAFFPRIFYII